jgi:phosphoglycerate-specific signal transduction histidine kinase
MSHLSEIIENHNHLEELFSIIKHYGVSAEFVTDALVQRFEQVDKGDEKEGNTEEETAYCAEILDTLNQYYARL